jgi:hypothetical protein
VVQTQARGGNAKRLCGVSNVRILSCNKTILVSPMRELPSFPPVLAGVQIRVIPGL